MLLHSLQSLLNKKAKVEFSKCTSDYNTLLLKSVAFGINTRPFKDRKTLHVLPPTPISSLSTLAFQSLPPAKPLLMWNHCRHHAGSSTLHVWLTSPSPKPLTILIIQNLPVYLWLTLYLLYYNVNSTRKKSCVLSTLISKIPGMVSGM